MILSSSEFRLLDRLRLNPNRSFGGRVRGERLTKKRGLSIEFSDFREYSEGDDLRHLDWNILARHDQPIMKTYRDEEDLAVHVLVDVSRSMGFGDPTKLEQAKRIGAAMAYSTLMGGDAVYPAILGRGGRPERGLRGRASYPKFCRWASGLQSESEQGLSAALKSFAASSARPGVAVIISDCLDPDTVEGLRNVAGRGHEIMLIQVLSPLDLDPDIEGDLRLIDCESGDAVEITASSLTLRRYRESLTAHNMAFMTEAVRLGGRALLIKSDTPVDAVIRDSLLRQRWLTP